MRDALYVVGGTVGALAVMVAFAVVFGGWR
jgi:hypothetical protein